MSTAAASSQQPPPLDTSKGSSHSSTSHGGGSNPLPSASYMLKAPSLVNNDDFDVVKALPNNAPWRPIYYEAHKMQEDQEKVWEDLCAEISKTKPKYWKEVQSKHINYWEKSKAQLDALNKKVEQLNQQNGGNTSKDFGKISPAPLRYAGLKTAEPRPNSEGDIDMDEEELLADKDLTLAAQEAGEKEWQAINSNPQVVEALRQPYSLGYLLQIYFNVSANTPETFDTAAFNEIAKLMNKLNKKIKTALKAVENEFTEDFGLLFVPRDGTLSIPLEGQNAFQEMEEDNPRPVPEDLVVPDIIQHFRAKIGGSDGLLSEVLRNMSDKFEIQDFDIKRRWLQHKNLVQRLAMKEGLEIWTTFDINLGQLKQLKVFVDDMKSMQPQIETQSGEADVQTEYLRRRNIALAAVKQLKFPANYADAIVMPMAQALKDYKATPSKPSPSLGDPSPELVETIQKAAIGTAASNGWLTRVIRGRVLEESDKEAESELTIYMENLRSQAGDFFGHQMLHNYILLEPQVLAMGEQAKTLVSLLNKEGDSPAVKRLIENIRIEYSLMSKAIIGDTDPVEELSEEIPPIEPGVQSNSKRTNPLAEQFKAQPINNSNNQKTRRQLRVVTAPSIEYTEDQLMTPTSVAGVVSDMVNGKEVHKSIQHFRAFTRTFQIEGKEHKIEWGHHLLLRWTRKGASQPTFEWTKASKFKGAVDEFKSTPGSNKEWAPGTRDDLRGLVWKNIKVGGVSFASRDESRTYDTTCPCHMLLFDTTKHKWTWKWFTISTIRSAFGEQRVDTARDAYCALSVQNVPKKSETKRELRRKLDESFKLNQKILLGSRDYKEHVSSRTRGRQRKVVHEVDESEDEGGESLGESDTEDDSASEESDGGDLNGFIEKDELNDEISAIEKHLAQLKKKQKEKSAKK